MDTWKEEEIEAYQTFDHELLALLYDNAILPREEPWKRAEYLTEGVLQITMTDYDLLGQIAKEKGRHEALNLLEKYVVEDLEGIDNPIAEIVRRGGYAQITLPNLETHGYANGLYRIHGPVIEIPTDRERRIFDAENIPMPTKIEALRTNENWEKFPRVVIHRAERKGAGIYYIFRGDGKYNTMEEGKTDLVFLNALGREYFSGATDHVSLFEKRND